MYMVDFGFQQFAPPPAALPAFSVSARVFWPYFTGVALLAIGLPVIIKNELPQAQGLDKIMPFGRLFFAIPMAVFASQHFTVTKFVVLLRLNHFVDTLLFSGAALVLADALAKEDHPHG